VNVRLRADMRACAHMSMCMCAHMLVCERERERERERGGGNVFPVVLFFYIISCLQLCV
jgi:hypothetical protein